MRVQVELAVTIAVYLLALLVSSLSNVWLSAWGRRLSLLHTAFRHGNLTANTAASTCSSLLLPFDLSALEAAGCSAPALTAASPVFDLGLHFLPHVHARWLPDAFVFLFIPLLCIAVFLPPPSTASRSSHWRRCLHRLCCVLQAHAAILFMRASTTLATTHRASPVCHALSLHHSDDNPGFLLNTGCWDLMFSGHSAFCALAAFFTLSAPSLPQLLRPVTLVLAVMGCAANVLVGDHFTADCLVAVYVTLPLCCLFRARWQRSFSPDTAEVGATRHAAAIATDSSPTSSEQQTRAEQHQQQQQCGLKQQQSWHEESKELHSAMDALAVSDHGEAEEKQSDGCDVEEVQALMRRWRLRAQHDTS